MAQMALEGGDPRLQIDAGKGEYGQASQAYTKPQMRKLHDSSIRFEEYHYFALRTREAEDRDAENMAGTRGILSTLFPTASGATTSDQEKRGSVIAATMNLSKADARAHISEEEWVNASRALRTATASAIFYLITTDILGPFGLPYAFASMGWGYVTTACYG